MYDIATPKEAYEKEVNKLKTQIKQVDNNSELNSGKQYLFYSNCKVDHVYNIVQLKSCIFVQLRV